MSHYNDERLADDGFEHFQIDLAEILVNSTGYVTVAERKPDWEQLPPGTPKLDESALVAGAPVFASPKQKFSLQSLAGNVER
jgi:hypothetical protein